MDKARAQEVLKKIDEILRWEAKVDEQKDQRFAELGKYLCEVRKQGYWRLGYRSFEHFLEAKFPDSRRKAYYLMSIHDHLKQIPTEEIESLGWSKALELAKVARSEGRQFDSATGLHRAKESTKQELKESIESTVEQKLLELLGDPDQGLVLKKTVKDRLIRQRKVVASGQRGESLAVIVKRLGLG